MIDFLKGIVTTVDQQRVTVLVQGVGFGVSVADETAFTVGQAADLLVHLHWNAELGPSLYGFQSIQEKEVFKLLIGCSGVGPKLALAVLADLSAGSFVSAVSEGDVKMLSSVSGIGAKKAENIILQLRDKVAKLADRGIDFGADGASAQRCSEVVNVLLSLDYSRPEIDAALKRLRDDNQIKDLSFDGLLRKALACLSKG